MKHEYIIFLIDKNGAKTYRNWSSIMKQYVWQPFRANAIKNPYEDLNTVVDIVKSFSSNLQPGQCIGFQRMG